MDGKRKPVYVGKNVQPRERFYNETDLSLTH
jgi:hypothetical protein